MTSQPLTQSRSVVVDHRVDRHSLDVRLEHPGEMLAAIPHMLGFHPVESLIVLGLCGPATNTVGVVLRVDLPPPPLAPMAADQLLVPLLQHKAVGVLSVVIGDRRPDSDDLPHRELLAHCEARFVDSGMPVVHQLWLPRTTAGLRWRCYDVADCTGLLPEPDDTAAAAAVSTQGLITYARREDVAASLTPEPSDVLERRAAVLDRFSTTVEPGCEPSDALDLTGSAEGRAHLAVVRAALADAAEPIPPNLAEPDLIRLIQALSDHRVRDTCLDFDSLPSIVGAERLWAALVRASPNPERADPASLLAFSAYARGDGVLAAAALDRARAADPGHRLTELLSDAVAMGVPASRLRDIGVEAARTARGELIGVTPL